MTKLTKTIRWPVLQKDNFKNWYITCANYEFLFSKNAFNFQNFHK